MAAEEDSEEFGEDYTRAANIGIGITQAASYVGYGLQAWRATVGAKLAARKTTAAGMGDPDKWAKSFDKLSSDQKVAQLARRRQTMGQGDPSHTKFTELWGKMSPKEREAFKVHTGVYGKADQGPQAGAPAPYEGINLPGPKGSNPANKIGTDEHAEGLVDRLLKGGPRKKRPLG
jgi:hypothetical protein